MRQKGWESELIKTFSALWSKTTTSYWGAKCSFLKSVRKTQSFVLQMLAAHNVAIIFNILRWLNHNQNFEQHWGKSIFMLLHRHTKKNRKEEKLSLLQLHQKWCSKFLPVTKSNNRRTGCHGILLPVFFHCSKFRIIEIVLLLALWDFCAA